MNKHKMILLGFSAALLLTACKKSDVIHQPSVETANAGTSIQWTTVSNWSAAPQEQYTVYSSEIKDSAITADIAANGMVLVYQKNGNQVSELPYEQAGTAGKSTFWYYQIAQGSLTLLADGYGSASTPAAQGFGYFILSADKLSQLESKGYSKAELMRLSYEKATAVLK